MRRLRAAFSAWRNIALKQKTFRAWLRLTRERLATKQKSTQTTPIKLACDASASKSELSAALDFDFDMSDDMHRFVHGVYLKESAERSPAGMVELNQNMFRNGYRLKQCPK